MHPLLGGEPHEAAEAVRAWFGALGVLVVGPGLGRQPRVLEAARLVMRAALEQPSLLLVVDGDGLWALRDDTDLLHSLGARTVLTPNVVEWSRLLQQLNGRSLEGPLVVRKGPSDDILGPGHQILLQCSTEGSPRRVSGQGDVLAGTVAAFILNHPGAQVEPELVWGACDAVREAQRRAFHKAKRGMLASDVLHALPDAMEALYPLQ